MKKKPLNNNKDNKPRVKTPDISSIKKKSNKVRKQTDTITTNNNTPQLEANLQKKTVLKSSINYSTKNELKQKKTKFTINKEKKEDQKIKNTNSDLVKEERANSASKKLFKNKKLKIEDKKETKKTNEMMNKTGDNFYKPKIQHKKNSVVNSTINNNINNNINKQRKKSVDIILDKKNKKPDKTKNDHRLKLSIKPKNLNKTTDNKKIKNNKKKNKTENEKDSKKNIEVVSVKKIEDKSKENKIEKEDKKIVEVKKKENKDIKDKENNKKIIENKAIVENNKTKVEEEKKVVLKKEEKKQDIKPTIKKEDKKEETKKEIKDEKKEEINKKNKEEIKKDKKEEIKDDKKIEDKNEEIKEDKKIEDKKEETIKEKENEKTHEKTLIKIEETKNKMIYIFMRTKKFSCNYKECLYLGLNSGFFNPKQKLNLMLNSKELYDSLNRQNLISELIKNYTKLGNKNLQKENKSEYDMVKVKSLFNPKERSLNSLDFIDKEEENKLMNELQHPYIIDYFKLILILLNEKNDKNKNIFEFFFKDLLQKHNAKDIKNLFIKNFVNSEILINDEQFNMIQKMIMIKPDLLSPATLLRYNRAVAYSSFFLKDLFNYLDLKTDDGKYYYQLRINSPKNEYQEKINKLKLLL